MALVELYAKNLMPGDKIHAIIGDSKFALEVEQIFFQCHPGKVERHLVVVEFSMGNFKDGKTWFGVGETLEVDRG